MTLINFFCIGYPGFVLGLEANRQRVQGASFPTWVKRALPASASVVVAACLSMGVASLLGFDKMVLSTMCLITTSSVGCCLIWRISQPFTPLRIVLFASIVLGVATGILLFPEFSRSPRSSRPWPSPSWSSPGSAA